MCRYKIRDDLQFHNLTELEKHVQPHDKISVASAPAALFNANMDDSLTWEFLAWMHSITDLPVFVKVTT